MATLPCAGPDAALVLRTGSLRDYALLAEHHYLARKPAMAMRVLVLEDPRRSVCARMRGEVAAGKVVGVLVESLPALSCRLRDEALGHRYGGLRDVARRAAVLNREVRCISRVVVHPQWRGLGLAVRLVREALVSATTVFTESLAAMGHVNPFFEHAGMTAYRRQAHEGDARLIAALSRAGLSAVDLAVISGAMGRIDKLEPHDRAWLREELTRWTAQTRRRRVRGELAMEDVLRAARERLWCEPVYYLWDTRETWRPHHAD